ncbi:hypothetical protein T459_28000 [Capsicum annuum]|uniref:RNA helicase n=1 Tax=Capsicum annuum TaxID=4072 RepID=A0A2G2YFI0_CAPAN|nr:hypothetical protein T459_28000 [Capsicum annuum]
MDGVHKVRCSSSAISNKTKGDHKVNSFSNKTKGDLTFQFCAELPLEPSLSRTLLEANELDCLSQALTVVSMLSSETTLLPVPSKSSEKRRTHTPSKLPDGFGLGDHIQLLQIYEQWYQIDYNINWCKENNLQVCGMVFVRDVRKQLSQIMQKIAKGSLDVQTSNKRRDGQQEYKNLRKALCIGYANQLAERMIRHNGYRPLGFKSELVQIYNFNLFKGELKFSPFLSLKKLEEGEVGMIGRSIVRESKANLMFQSMHVLKRRVLATKMIICGRVELEVVMDDYSVINSITHLMVSMLGLPFFPKQNPFVTPMRFLVDRRVKASISLGNYQERFGVM